MYTKLESCIYFTFKAKDEENWGGMVEKDMGEGEVCLRKIIENGEM